MKKRTTSARGTGNSCRTFSSFIFLVPHACRKLTPQIMDKQKMSSWCHRRDKSGKKILWEIDYDPLIFFVIIGLLAGLVGPSLFRNPALVIFFPCMLLLSGLTCLVISKISLYKKGIRFSFGPSLMSKGFATLYKIAYILLGIGILLLLLLFIGWLQRAQVCYYANRLWKIASDKNRVSEWLVKWARLPNQTINPLNGLR